MDLSGLFYEWIDTSIALLRFIYLNRIRKKKEKKQLVVNKKLITLSTNKLSTKYYQLKTFTEKSTVSLVVSIDLTDEVD